MKTYCSTESIMWLIQCTSFLVRIAYPKNLRETGIAAAAVVILQVRPGSMVKLGFNNGKSKSQGHLTKDGKEIRIFGRDLRMKLRIWR